MTSGSYPNTQNSNGFSRHILQHTSLLTINVEVSQVRFPTHDPVLKKKNCYETLIPVPNLDPQKFCTNLLPSNRIAPVSFRNYSTTIRCLLKLHPPIYYEHANEQKTPCDFSSACLPRHMDVTRPKQSP